VPENEIAENDKRLPVTF